MFREKIPVWKTHIADSARFYPKEIETIQTFKDDLQVFYFKMPSKGDIYNAQII